MDEFHKPKPSAVVMAGVLDHGSLTNKTFNLESGAYDGLHASGGLNVIHDEELRNRLAAWPRYDAEWSEEEDAVFSSAHETLVPQLSAYIRSCAAWRNCHKAIDPRQRGLYPSRRVI